MKVNPAFMSLVNQLSIQYPVFRASLGHLESRIAFIKEEARFELIMRIARRNTANHKVLRIFFLDGFASAR